MMDPQTMNGFHDFVRNMLLIGAGGAVFVLICVFAFKPGEKWEKRPTENPHEQEGEKL